MWTAVEEGTPIERSRASRTRDNQPLVRASLVQVTNLGISVKDSPQNTLSWSRGSTTPRPCPARASRSSTPDGKAMWTGTTGADGVAIAPQTRLRDPRNWYEFAFLVMAEKDGDVAYVGSDWNDGILPWEYGSTSISTKPIRCCAARSSPIAASTSSGEEVHFKAILRSNTPGGVRLLPDGTAVFDRRPRQPQQGRRRAHGQGERLEHGGMDASRVPPEGALGSYFVRAILESDRARSRPAPAAESGRARRARLPRVEEDGHRVVPRRRVSPARLPRRRHADRRLAHRRGSAERRRHRALPLRRADGQASDALDVHAHARSSRRRRRLPRSFRPSAGRSSAGPSSDDHPRPDRDGSRTTRR